MKFYELAADTNLAQIGATMDGNFLQFCDATGGVIAELGLDTPALGTPASGSVTINPTTADTSSAAGTIGFAKIVDSSSNDLYYFTVSDTTGADITVPSLVIPAGIELDMNIGTLYYNLAP